MSRQQIESKCTVEDVGNVVISSESRMERGTEGKQRWKLEEEKECYGRVNNKSGWTESDNISAGKPYTTRRRVSVYRTATHFFCTSPRDATGLPMKTEDGRRVSYVTDWFPL
jgi:hypothetical protein